MIYHQDGLIGSHKFHVHHGVMLVRADGLRLVTSASNFSAALDEEFGDTIEIPVRPAIDGPIVVEAYIASSDDERKAPGWSELATAVCESGYVIASDPEGLVTIRIPIGIGGSSLTVMADDIEYPKSIRLFIALRHR